MSGSSRCRLTHQWRCRWASAQQGHVRLWIREIRLGFSANVAVGGVSHHIVELLSGDMNESTMVSALKPDGEEARPTRLPCVRLTPRCGPNLALRSTFGCVPAADRSAHFAPTYGVFSATARMAQAGEADLPKLICFG